MILFTNNLVILDSGHRISLRNNGYQRCKYHAPSADGAVKFIHVALNVMIGLNFYPSNTYEEHETRFFEGCDNHDGVVFLKYVKSTHWKSGPREDNKHI